MQRKRPHALMIASDGVISEGYGHDGPGVCLGDGQTEAHLKDMGMTGLASAWAMARRRPIWRIWAWRTWCLPGRWPDGGLSEGYGHGGPGVCLGDGQTEAYLKDMGMTGLASAWTMARRRTKEYRRKVDAATRRSGVCPHT